METFCRAAWNDELLSDLYLFFCCVHPCKKTKKPSNIFPIEHTPTPVRKLQGCEYFSRNNSIVTWDRDPPSIIHLFCSRVRLYESTSPGGFSHCAWRLRTPVLLSLIVLSAMGAETPLPWQRLSKIDNYSLCLKRSLLHTCPSLHWHGRVQFASPCCHGDGVTPSWREHVERALPGVRVHLSRADVSIIWKTAWITEATNLKKKTFWGFKVTMANGEGVAIS